MMTIISYWVLDIHDMT